MRLTIGGLAESPVPVKVTVCGVPWALSLIVRVPGMEPTAVGLKVTLTTHEANPESTFVQVDVSEY